SSTTSTTVRASSSVWARLIVLVSSRGAAPKIVRVSAGSMPLSQSMKFAMPAWATRPTQERSRALRRAYQSCLSSRRRVDAVARSPPLRRTVRRVVRETRPRRDTRPVYVRSAQGRRCRESVGAELHGGAVERVVLVVEVGRGRVGG